MLDLEPIKKRHSEASGGPWQIVGDNIKINNYSYLAHTVDMFVCNDGKMHPTRAGEHMYPGDLQFVYHAHTDIPALVAEVEQLRKTIKEQNNAGN